MIADVVNNKINIATKMNFIAFSFFADAIKLFNSEFQQSLEHFFFSSAQF
jgi:hypothetical protein